MALGATRRDIISLILRQGLGMTLAGVGLGLAGAFGVTRLFKSLLVGVSATDGVSFSGRPPAGAGRARRHVSARRGAPPASTRCRRCATR